MGRPWWSLTALLALVSVLMRDELLFLLSLFLGFVGLVSLIWSRLALAEVYYRRRLDSRRLFVGEETELTVEIVNAKPLPLAWVRVDDELPSALLLPAAQTIRSHRAGRVYLVNLLSLRWYERVTRRYRLIADRRGAYRIGPVELSSGDIFGFGVQRRTLEDTATVIVYPRIVPLTALGMPALRPFGALRSDRRLVEDPMRVSGVRDYAPGDSYRHIHWKATAHRRALHTKVFEPAASLPIAIMLNINTFEYRFEGLDRELQEYAITAAASLASWAVSSGHAVGLYANSITQPNAQRVRIRPRSHPGQLPIILEALARIVMVGRWPIERIVEVETAHLPQGSTVAVVTATMNERLRRALRAAHHRNLNVVLITLGAAGDSPRLPGIRQHHIGGHEEWHDLASLVLPA